MRRHAVVVLLVLVSGLFGVLPGGVTDVSAHATMVRAEPGENSFLQTAPSRILLVFSEPLDAEQSNITLVDARGQLVLAGAEISADKLSLRLALGPLSPGIYNVLWENVSTVDGHALRGSYPFTVLLPGGGLPDGGNLVATTGSSVDPPPPAENAAVRALSLFGLVLLVAAALPWLLVRPFRRTRAMFVLGAAAVLILVVATTLNLAALHDTNGGRPLGSLLADTRLGQAWFARVAAVVIAVVALLSGRRARHGPMAMLGAAALFLGSYTATSHAAAGTGSAWAMVGDYLHGAAALAWIGAVSGLAVYGRTTAQSPGNGDLLSRFAFLASLSVFVLLATGFLNALVLLDSFDRLWTTRYGMTLLVKLGVMVPLMFVALWNARRGRREMERQRPGGATALVRTAYFEGLLGLAVIAAAATLTQSTVAKNVFERPQEQRFDQSAPALDLSVNLTVDPNRTGINTYAVSLRDAAGAAVDASRVRLTFRYQDDQQIGASTLALARNSPGEFSGVGPFLTLEGDWRVEVEVRRDGHDDALAFFDVRPAGSTVGFVRLGGPWDNPAAGLSWNEFGGVVALFIGTGLALFKPRLPRRPKQLGWGANGATMSAFGFGLLLLFGVHGHTPLTGLPRNPVFPDADSIARGRQIYETNCVACHGRSGVPPAGLKLDPYPLDLTVHVPQHPDGQLYLFVSDGLAGTAMRAWGDGPGSLSDQDIWHVVNFLRTLGATDR